MSETKWTRYHDICYLYVAMIIIDGPIQPSESGMLLRCMRDWKPDMTRAHFAPLYRSVLRKALKVSGGLELVRSVETCAAGLAESIGGNSKRSKMLLEHLRRVAEIDGPLAPGEQFLLQAVITHLGLNKRIAMTVKDGFATFGAAAK